MIDNKAFYKLSYGLYVVSSIKEGKKNAQIANTVFQISSDPLMVAVSINKQNLTHEFIDSSGLIGISVLSEDTPLDFIGRFGFKSGRNTDKFAGVLYKTLESGVPIVLDNSVSYLELMVEKKMDVYTHTVYICRVLNAEVLKDQNQLTYQHYQDIKRGKSAAPAPAAVNKEPERPAKASVRYQCTVCGFIYDSSEGDPGSGIPAGTMFEDLPDDWVCPICGVPKDKFKKID